ncbi:unnamed protein product [marine sediment metagenome]|uniref:Uncharacterized protein n=1 Tax=marine sediment metagenome TaxID=412755 RepID=X0TKL0_9ZZZZ
MRTVYSLEDVKALHHMCKEEHKERLERVFKFHPNIASFKPEILRRPIIFTAFPGALDINVDAKENLTIRVSDIYELVDIFAWEDWELNKKCPAGQGIPYRIFRRFLYEVPLEEVPLYANKEGYHLLTPWRLQIGK